jgi:LmbE family N-acetylglucosaminyl deacetylase
MRFPRLLCVSILVAFFAFTAPVTAGVPLPEDRGAAGLWQALLELRTTGSVLYIDAHPDDEDGPFLTMLSRGQGVRCMKLTLTRGEGGADRIAPFFFDALGLLRSLEIAQSARYYKCELFHSRVVDYGFSKTIDETMSQWGGQDNILRDIVRIIRRERPDILLARFRGDRRDGHGNHQTAGVIVPLAFEAAGDPNRFPEQLADGLPAWQPKKAYANTIRPEFRPEDKDFWTLVVSTGDYDPVLGRSYAQMAREGLSFQRSQGAGGTPARPGEVNSYYRLTKTAIPSYAPAKEECIFDGIDTSILGIAAVAGAQPPAFLVTGLKAIQDAVDSAFMNFSMEAPHRTAPALTKGLKHTRAVLKEVKGASIDAAARDHIVFLLERKERQFQQALKDALGLDVQVTALPDEIPTGPFAAFRFVPTFNHAIPGQTFAVGIDVVNRSPVEVQPLEAAVKVPAGWTSEASEVKLEPIGYNQQLSTRFRVKVADNAQPARPCWHRDSIEESVYQVDDPDCHTYPFPPPPAWGVVKLEVLGVPVQLKEPVRVSIRHPLYDALQPPLTVVPAIGVQIEPEYGVIPLGQTSYAVHVVVHSNVKGPAEGTVSLELPAGWSSRPASAPFSFAKEDEEGPIDFELSVPANVRAQSYTVRAVARYAGKEYSEGYTTVTARDLGRFNLYTPARLHINGVDVKVASGLRVGYVMGSGDEIPQSLELLGVRPVMLTATDLASADLSVYDTIILGIRAYATRPDVITYNGRLLEYVNNGGVLIVQYQTTEYNNNYGPYPYDQGRAEEVTEEDSKVTMLAPDNPIFNTPNKITEKDFEGWVEERGSKWLETWDPRYTPLLETHDQNQELQKGGFVYARYGKGVYMYSAYAWYRQLPHGVPGAFRIYANMISLGKTAAQ